MHSSILYLILYYSSVYGIDPSLVQAIVKVESNGDNARYGELGEVGLMQLRPEYFHHDVDYLRNNRNNLRLGIKFLAELKKECPHKEDNTFVVCYNLGVGGGAKIKHPKKFIYYRKVMKEYDIIRGSASVEDLSI